MCFLDNVENATEECEENERHMCLHRNKDSHLVLGEDSVAEINDDLLETREKRRKPTKPWNLPNGETQEISAAVDQVNAQQVLANATSRATSVTVQNKGNSQAYANSTGNRWSGRQQVPKRLPIRPPDNLKPGGEANFATVHQLDYTQRYADEISSRNLSSQPTAAETQEASWNHRQIPKTQPIRNPDSILFSGPLNLETTNKRDFTENVFQSKASEYAQGETTHRPRTSLKLSGEFQSDSSYQTAYTQKHAEDFVKVKKGTSVSHLKPEGDMTFDTTSLDYNAAVSEQKKWESVSNQSVPLKPKPAKPQSGIKIPEVPLEDETTAVTDYKRWNVGKPERHKPADTLKLGDGITDVEEYASSLASKVYSDEDKKVDDARWQVSRPVIRKPESNLKSEGNFNFATTNDIDYSSRRSRYSQSNLETVTERTERDPTETVTDAEIAPAERHVSTGVEQPTNVEKRQRVDTTQKEPETVAAESTQTYPTPRAITPPPLEETDTERVHFQSSAHAQPEAQTEIVGYISQNGEPMEYVTWDQVRPKPIRPHSNLRQEGGMEFNTTNRSEYIQKSSERVKGIRPKTSTRVFEGDFDAKTMNQIMFSNDPGERANPIRPRSNLHVENGQFAGETTTAREYQQWEIKRPSPIIHKSNLTQEGSIDFTTTNKTEFEEKHSEKVYPIRPSTTNRISGDFDLTTTNQVMHGSFPIERVQKIVPKSNLRTSSGAFNPETTNRTQFQEYQIDRPKPIRPVSNLHQEGAMDFRTTNQMQFEGKQTEKVSQFRPHTSSKMTGAFDGTTTNNVMHGVQPMQKPQMIKPKGNIEVEKGSFARETTNNMEFQQWQGAKPQPVTPRNNLQQEGNIDFTTTNQVQYGAKTIDRVAQIRPKSNPKLTGDFDGTTTNKIMYQNVPGEKSKSVRPKTNIQLERGNFGGETTNNIEFQTWGYEKPSAIKPHSSMRQEGTMDFTTTNNTQFEGKTSERPAQIRPTTSTKITGDFDGTTTNQVMYQNNPLETVRGKRPSTNIHLETGRFEDQTTARREYQQWEMARAEPIVPTGNLAQEGTMDFTTSNQREFGAKTITKAEQIRPHTSSPITGDFDGTTTNQVMYQGQVTDKIHDIRPRDNLRVQSGEFNPETTNTREYGHKTGGKPDLIKPKPNLSQDGDFDFVTSNQMQYEGKTTDRVSQTRPKTHTKMSEGKFYGKTTNQAMYQTPEMETVHSVRPQTHLRVDEGTFQGNTTVTDAYQQWKTERPKAFQLASSLKQEGDMSFETTNSSEFREKTFERVQQIRPKTSSKIEGDFETTTTNQAMYHQPEKLDRVKPIRHENNLHVEQGTISGETTTRREYKQWVKGNQIAVPKKKLQAAGIRTQGERGERRSRRKEITNARENNMKETPRENENETWKLAQQDASDPKNIMNSNEAGADHSPALEEAKSLTTPKEKSVADTSAKEDIQESIEADIEHRPDISTMRADYEGKQGTRVVYSQAPQGNLTDTGDSNGDIEHRPDISTMRADYEGKQGTRVVYSQAPQGNLTNTGDRNGDIEHRPDISTMRADYEGKQGTRVVYSQAPQGNLTDTGDMNGDIEHRPDISTMRADYEGKQGTRVYSIVPHENLTDTGDMNFQISSNDYGPQHVSANDRNQASKSQEIINQSGGKEVAGRENPESWTLATGEESSRVKIAIATEAGSRTARQQEQVSDARQSIQGMKAPKRYRPHDNLKIEHVPFNGTSTTQTEYKKWEGRKSSSKRRGENLKQEGKMQFDTTSNDYSVLRDYQHSREATRPKIKEELKKGTLTPTGNMEFSTTSKTSYVGATSVVRARNLRPRSSLRLGVSDTSNQEMSSSRSNPEISSSHNKYDLTSTSRAAYVGYTGTRTRANRPSTSQKVGEGAFEGQSTTRSTFTMPQNSVAKSKTIKPANHNILDTGNGFSGDTTYRSSFEEKKGHCPVLDLDAGKSQLTFNEEKNGHIFYAPRVQG